MKFSKVLAILSVLTCVMIWGLLMICLKASVGSFPPMTLNLLRFGSAALFLFIILRIKEKNTRIMREDIYLLIITGGLGIFTYYCVASLAMKYITASSAGIITGTIPIFTLIGEIVLFNKRIKPVNCFSILMSVTGLYLVIGGGTKELISSKYILGNLLMILAVLSWVLYTLFTGKLSSKYSGLTSVTYQTIFGAAFFIPFSIFELTKSENFTEVLSIVNRADDLKVVAINIVFVGIISSAIGYSLYIYGMKVIGVSASSLFMNLSPVVTLIASYFILKEAFTLNQLIGSILILLSVIVINLEVFNFRKESTVC